MSDQSPATVRVIAMLHGYCCQHGLPVFQRVQVPAEGISARALAERLSLPIEMIDGVFLDHRGVGLDAIVEPGARVAYVPKGTPASHPAFFGRFKTRTGA
ncbi:MAG TPA: MoaD/ThiS family protein [Coriobacteriia bacterium]|nr:MoaD/ThiS family protein [Coriobacteriia bacterium]